MLQFMKPKMQTGLMVSVRKPDSIEESHTDGNEDNGLDACAEDLIRALHSKDIKSVSAALKAAFDILESMPHEEGPHVEEGQE